MTPQHRIGVIADDFTGATDAALALRRSGLRTLLAFEDAASNASLPSHDALVIGLKTRTIPPQEAVDRSLQALKVHLRAEAETIYFKYCSTFDSTPAGNIGPVMDAVAETLNVERVVTTPASPEHGRTVTGGELFVDGIPLNQTHMRFHPLTPMEQSYLPVMLEAQSKFPVRLITQSELHSGALDQTLTHAGTGVSKVEFIVVDAEDSVDLDEIARSIVDAPFVAGAAGLIGALGRQVAQNREASIPESDDVEKTGLRTAILSGSCSQRTLEQLDYFAASGGSVFHLDARSFPSASELADRALEWWDALPVDADAAIASSVPPEVLAAVQAELGVHRSAEILEGAVANIAVGLWERGVRRFISAGGETSGAVVTALPIGIVELEDEAAPGVPWVRSTGDDRAALLLKSGNFGTADLFVQQTREK